jgi:putative transposase
MSASAKGTVENPGTNVAQKSGLNRAILDQCWGEIRRQLEYKSSWYGSTLFFVNPAYTSQECSNCNHIAAESRESQAMFCCVECGYEQHADVNAATVILERGLVSSWTVGTTDREPEVCPLGTPAVISHAFEDAQPLKTPEIERPSRNTEPRGLDTEATDVLVAPKPST